jgi:hypothetical protein
MLLLEMKECKDVYFCIVFLPYVSAESIIYLSTPIFSSQ